MSPLEFMTITICRCIWTVIMVSQYQIMWRKMSVQK